jgi:ATP-binding cassette, subfamily B, bacterial
MTGAGASIRALWRVVKPELLRHKGAVAASFASLFGALLVDLLNPWPLKIVIDYVLIGKPVPAHLHFLEQWIPHGLQASTALGALAASIAVLAVLGGVFAYAQGFMAARIGHSVVYAVRHALFERLSRLTMSYHTGTQVGELQTRVASDTNTIRDAFADWTMKALGELLLLTGILVVMALMNWQLAAVVAATLPVLFFVLRRLSLQIRQSARAQRRQDGRVATRLTETLRSMALVQSFGREEHELARFDAESARARDTGIHNARVSSAVSKTVGVTSAVAGALTVLLGGRLALRGELTPGDLLIFVSYVAALFKPIRDLGKLWAKFSRARVSAERIGELLLLQPEITDAPGAIQAAGLHGAICFDQARFGYASGSPILNRASFNIEPGEHVAIIGPSGAGKSTMLRLLVRLYELQGGAIRIDGVPIQRYTRESLRREIGVVLQDAVFVGSSIRENIAYGKLGAGAAEIERAARLAGVHDFVSSLALGYESVVGEGGCTLSGGQRQRLCLARTLIRDPSILILDEPTSAVDPDSARFIEQAIAEHRRGRTTLVIGHQFSSLERFDRVIELADGITRDLTGQFDAGPTSRLLARLAQ